MLVYNAAHAEPNTDSPLNSSAASLWKNQDGLSFSNLYYILLMWFDI